MTALVTPYAGEMASGLLAEYVARHNHGLASGDYGAMLDLFHDFAEIVFVGLPVGPFVGRAAIASAFRDNPPDDQLVLLSDGGEDVRASARYGWQRDPTISAGVPHLPPAGR